MLIIEAIRDRDHLLVEPVIAGLVAADQQYGGPQRVEGVEYAERVSLRSTRHATLDTRGL